MYALEHEVGYLVVKKVFLIRENSSESKGWEIQGLQKSKTFNGKDIRDIVVQSISKGKLRGGHYHKQKTEWFFAVEGKAKLLWCEQKSAKDEDLKEIRLDEDYENPYVLEITPETCHWVKNDSDNEFIMIAFSSEEYNKDNPDKPKCEYLNCKKLEDCEI